MNQCGFLVSCYLVNTVRWNLWQNTIAIPKLYLKISSEEWEFFFSTSVCWWNGLKLHYQRYNHIAQGSMSKAYAPPGLGVFIENKILFSKNTGMKGKWFPDQGHFNFNIAWINDHLPRKVWDGIIYPFSNFNGCTVEVWEWISYFIPHWMSLPSEMNWNQSIKN